MAFDGPGQGESEYDFAIRGDYEVAVKAVIDWLEPRPDIDAGKIGLWGVSLGGYYAPRAALRRRSRARFIWLPANKTAWSPGRTRSASRGRRRGRSNWWRSKTAITLPTTAFTNTARNRLTGWQPS
ncbi:MAG: hypothetical protein HYS65_12100 [Betaproteobacteria bacterium]|nr:hypothetical protein [Betaproteobacteria bacterium]MBI2226160.1 hypothetical protein [Betaproteobacteria bacterium]MBI3056054.1 hypothetical protein [Betaproteobacteria bacterium]